MAVLTIGFSRNELPIFIIVSPIPILIFKKYCSLAHLLPAISIVASERSAISRRGRGSIT